MAHSQTVTSITEAGPSHLSITDFGLSYPLPNNWVRATEMIRKRDDSAPSPQNYDILLAAVYVPKSNISADNPFFTLDAYRQPATNCKKSLEAMIARSETSKEKTEGTVVEFTTAGREYYRVNVVHGIGGRHRCFICTAAEGHLLVWNASAPNEKGLEAIVATLNSIALLPKQSAAGTGQSGRRDVEADAPPKPVVRPERVKVASGVTQGLFDQEGPSFLSKRGSCCLHSGHGSAAS